MSSLADTYITYRIIKILVTPWKEQEAYKLGIIDNNGKVLKKSKELQTSKEKDAYTVLIRFVFLYYYQISKVDSFIHEQAFACCESSHISEL